MWLKLTTLGMAAGLIVGLPKHAVKLHTACDRRETDEKGDAPPTRPSEKEPSSAANSTLTTAPPVMWPCVHNNT